MPVQCSSAIDSSTYVHFSSCLFMYVYDILRYGIRSVLQIIWMNAMALPGNNSAIFDPTVLENYAFLCIW